MRNFVVDTFILSWLFCPLILILLTIGSLLLDGALVLLSRWLGVTIIVTGDPVTYMYGIPVTTLVVALVTALCIRIKYGPFEHGLTKKEEQ